jgi:dTDP-glucose 4,6-dehydratase
VTNCSNNFGPYQYPEKFIPVMILNALAGMRLPIYGRGDQVRDWLYVDDHVAALCKVLDRGRVGDTYNIGGDSERSNIDVVRAICSILDRTVPELRKGVASYAELIEHVEDRPGHDTRYAIDASKTKSELRWAPSRTFDDGLRQTITWYLENASWCQRVYARGAKRERRGLVRKTAP